MLKISRIEWCNDLRQFRVSIRGAIVGFLPHHEPVDADPSGHGCHAASFSIRAMASIRLPTPCGQEVDATLRRRGGDEEQFLLADEGAPVFWDLFPT